MLYISPKIRQCCATRCALGWCCFAVRCGAVGAPTTPTTPPSQDNSVRCITSIHLPDRRSCWLRFPGVQHQRSARQGLNNTFGAYTLKTTAAHEETICIFGSSDQLEFHNHSRDCLKFSLSVTSSGAVVLFCFHPSPAFTRCEGLGNPLLMLLPCYSATL